MQAKAQNPVTWNIFADFMRFMLASLAAGITAAVLLSSAVIAVSSHAPSIAIAPDKHS